MFFINGIKNLLGHAQNRTVQKKPSLKILSKILFILLNCRFATVIKIWRLF
jgi:hypothetical protein